MTTKTKPELMIASCPDRAVDTGHSGIDTTRCAVRIPLRLVDPADKWICDDDFRAASDLGLYLRADVDGTVSIDVRAMDIYSASLRDMELRVKLLKRLHAKAERAGFTLGKFARNASVYEQLVRCMEAIGIRRTVECHSIAALETFAPVSLTIKRIADAIDQQLAAMRQRKAA